jgi:hypothetical protein
VAARSVAQLSRMKERFTIEGSEALEEHLQRTCEKVREEISRVLPEDKLEAVYLGGGYGRGEGGVLKTDDGDKPYNDLEFWVFVRGNQFLNERKYRDALHHLAEELSPEAGAEVEFKIASAGNLKKNTTMFAYDLAMGNRPVFGPDNLLNVSELRDGLRIPLHEATRLLMNRCTGLLFSEERLARDEFTAADADFVGRNQAKAQLGFGDALLAAFGLYHWSCRERSEQLKKLSEDVGAGNALAHKLPFSISKIHCHHALGVEFKLRPQQKTGAAESFRPLQTELRQLGAQLWLWLEGKRLHATFASARDYALSDIDKCPETSAARNRLVNAKTFGAGMLLKMEASRYPRERLLNSLALLLWEPDVLEHPFLLETIQHNLRTDAATFPGLVSAYEKLWRKFN